MNYNQTFPSFNSLLPKNLITISNNAHNQLINILNQLVQNGELPEDSLSDFQIQFLLTQFSLMDTNNLKNKMGVGEREARVQSSLIQQRYFYLLHGMGRSGNLTELQPKATGSSLLQKITHKLLKNTLKQMGLGKVSSCVILPVATGMALTLTLLSIIPENPNKKKVVFLRIDQKSCFKSIYTAGLTALVIENKEIEGEEKIRGLETDYEQLEKICEQQKEEILCVMSTSSCFAPREPDDLIKIGKICKKFGLIHLVNNAYGLQCTKTINMLNEANSQNLVDFVIQSTDKNFLVPVGGSIVWSCEKKNIQKLSENYPGRCSINAVLDLFISLLQLGSKKLFLLISERKQNFIFLKEQMKKFALKNNEILIENKRNQISLAITLKNIGKDAQEFGAWLFNIGIMGARVVVQNENKKKLNQIEFSNYGGHIEKKYEGFPYMTIAAAIGSTREELEKFVVVFEEQYFKFLKKKNIQENKEQLILEKNQQWIIQKTLKII